MIACYYTKMVNMINIKHQRVNYIKKHCFYVQLYIPVWLHCYRLETTLLPNSFMLSLTVCKAVTQAERTEQSKLSLL